MSALISLITAAFMLLAPAGVLASDLLLEAPASRCSPSFPSDSLIEWSCMRLGKDATLPGLFGVWWPEVARFNRIDRRHAWPWRHIKVPVDPLSLKGFTPMPESYPSAEGDPKLILIDLSEQFLGAYEYGHLVRSFPIASGEKDNKTPAGDFRVTAFSRNHRSSKYTIEGTEKPYPMNYALRFWVNRDGVAYWMHGRDMPGRPASHGCVGLYDEFMQQRYYGTPKDPVLDDARVLYEWAIGDAADTGRFTPMKDKVRVVIIGKGNGNGNGKAP